MNKEMETYFEQNATDGFLSDDAMAKLLVGDMGDTSTVEDSGKQPEPAPAKEVGLEQQPASEPEGDGKPDNQAVESENEEPVILAKDGKNVIEYEKLVEARNEAKAAKEANRALMQEMESIREQIAALKDGKDDKQGAPEPKPELVNVHQLEREWHEAILDDDPENAVAIRAKINAEIARQVREETTREFEAKLTAKEQEAENIKAQSLLDAAADEVAKAYPALDLGSDNGDKDKVAEVVEYRDFLIQSKGMPAHEALTLAAKRIMGEPQKKEEPAGGDTPVKPKVEPTVKARTPTTMSDIPAGTAPHHDEAEALMQMSNTALLGKMMTMDPDKIADLMARLV